MAAKPKTQDVQQTHKTAPKPVQPAAEAVELQVEQEPFELLLQRARLEPDSISPKDSSRIQRTIGNQAYQQLNNAMGPTLLLHQDIRLMKDLVFLREEAEDSLHPGRAAAKKRERCNFAQDLLKNHSHKKLVLSSYALLSLAA